jgi:hypothetical protein
MQQAKQNPSFVRQWKEWMSEGIVGYAQRTRTKLGGYSKAFGFALTSRQLCLLPTASCLLILLPHRCQK